MTLYSIPSQAKDTGVIRRHGGKLQVRKSESMLQSLWTVTLGSLRRQTTGEDPCRDIFALVCVYVRTRKKSVQFESPAV
jgi:hypothetical protein